MVYSRIREGFDGKLDVCLEATRRTIWSGIVISSAAWMILIIAVTIGLLTVSPSAESVDNPGTAWLQQQLVYIAVIGVLVFPVSRIARTALHKIRNKNNLVKEVGWALSGIVILAVSGILLFYLTQHLKSIIDMTTDPQTPLGGIFMLSLTGLYCGLGVTLFTCGFRGILSFLVGIREVDWKRVYSGIIRGIRYTLNLGPIKQVWRGLSAYYNHCIPNYTKLVWGWMPLCYIGIKAAFSEIQDEVESEEEAETTDG